jgi:hypothetical protein
MSGRWVIRYPEAEAKYQYYLSAFNKLESYQDKIQNEIGSVLIETNSKFKSSDLNGDYYKVYCGKIDDWIDDAKDILKRYQIFISDLNGCISATDSKVDYYNRLRQEREWIEDVKYDLL